MQIWARRKRLQPKQQQNQYIAVEICSYGSPHQLHYKLPVEKREGGIEMLKTIDRNRPVPFGYTCVNTDWARFAQIFCPWYLYPVCRAWARLVGFYYYILWTLYLKGCFDAEPGQVIRLIDLKILRRFRKK